MSSPDNFEYNKIEEDETSQLDSSIVIKDENDVEHINTIEEDEDEDFKLDDMEDIDDIEGLEDMEDMEETLLENPLRFDIGNKNKKSKSLRKKIIITIILFILLVPIIAYVYPKIYKPTPVKTEEEDINDKLRKFVRIIDTDDSNNYNSWNNTTGNKNAYLIMFTSEGEKVDNYYMYVSAITYRLLHKENIRTKRKDIDVVVMVTEDVADWKLRGLHNLGAIVKRVNKIQMGTDNINQRWINCYTKLQMFQMLEYETIVYLDADLYIKKNIDELFDLAKEVRSKTGRNDFFGAVTDGAIRNQLNNTENKGKLNAGLMILTPEIAVYKDLLELAPKKELYDSYFMEQGLLNLYYSDFDNKFNRTRYHIDARYNAQWFDESSMEFYDKVYVIHQKLGKLEHRRNKQVQKDIVNSIIEWIHFVDKETEVDITFDDE